MKEEAEAAMHKQGTTYWWLLDGYQPDSHGNATNDP